MIAHPERNKEVVSNVDKINAFVEQGCLLQVTAMSVAGRFGDAAQNIANILLERDWVTILASDAHNSRHRPPVLSEGVQAAAVIVGDDKASAMVSSIPKRIISGHESS